MRLSKQKNFRISPELDAALQAAAGELDVNDAVLLRGGAALAVKDPAKALAAARRLGSPSPSASASRRAPSGRSGNGKAATGTGGAVGSKSPAVGTDARAVHPVDLATWLAGRTGMPKALLERDIKRGAVRVAGVVVTERLVPGPLRDVTLDGEPV